MQRYAKLTDQNTLEYWNGKPITIGELRWSNPNASILAKAGFLPVPEIDSSLVIKQWDTVDGALVPTYGEAFPRPPRIFSKLKIVIALKQAGLWDGVKAWIEDAGLWDEYLACTNFSEANEYFTSGIATLKSQLGVTDEQIEAVLSASVV